MSFAAFVTSSILYSEREREGGKKTLCTGRSVYSCIYRAKVNDQKRGSRSFLPIEFTRNEHEYCKHFFFFFFYLPLYARSFKLCLSKLSISLACVNLITLLGTVIIYPHQQVAL